MKETVMSTILKHTEYPQTHEMPAKASEAIKAGMLIKRDASTDTWVKVGAIEAVSAVIVADARPNLDPDTAYADGDTIVGLVNPPGYEGILASGQNVARLEPLMSAANGELTSATLLTQAVDEAGSATFTITNSKVVGVAESAVNASGGALRINVLGR